MTTNEPYVCIVMYFDEFRVSDWALRFVSFANRIAGLLDAPFTHFSLSYDGDEYQLKKEKVYRYLNRNISKLETVLAERELQNLCYDHSPTRNIVTDSRLCVHLVLNTREYDPYKRIYIEFAQNMMSSNGMTDFVHSLVAEADTFADAQYGLATTMLQAQLPAFYFGDIYTSQLSQEEILNLAIWESHRTQYKRKIRGAYWGNLLSEGHLKAIGDLHSFLVEIEEIVGRDNVKRLSSGKLFFFVPQSHESVNAVRELLNRYDLIVRADGTEIIPARF